MPGALSNVRDRAAPHPTRQRTRLKTDRKKRNRTRTTTDNALLFLRAECRNHSAKQSGCHEESALAIAFALWATALSQLETTLLTMGRFPDGGCATNWTCGRHAYGNANASWFAAQRRLMRLPIATREIHKMNARHQRLRAAVTTTAALGVLACAGWLSATEQSGCDVSGQSGQGLSCEGSCATGGNECRRNNGSNSTGNYKYCGCLNDGGETGCCHLVKYID